MKLLTASLALVTLSTSALAQATETAGQYAHHGDRMGGHFGGGYHGFGLLITIAVLLVIAYAVRKRCKGHHGASGLSILEERYAKGEIDTAEFEDRKKTLRGK